MNKRLLSMMALLLLCGGASRLGGWQAGPAVACFVAAGIFAALAAENVPFFIENTNA